MADNTAESTAGFQSSRLGTKEYWDDHYKTEIQLLQESGDVGEVWFGYESVQRVVRWLSRCELVDSNSSIIDVGCGNAVMLTELAEEEFADLTGVDYSEASIELARGVCEKEGYPDIKCEVADLLEQSSPAPSLQRVYDVCIDKGTYDAISLYVEHPEQQRECYSTTIKRILKEGGLFILTSCNWTVEEVKTHFSQGFTFLEELPSKTFQFGGKTGSDSVCVVFKRDS